MFGLLFLTWLTPLVTHWLEIWCWVAAGCILLFFQVPIVNRCMLCNQAWSENTYCIRIKVKKKRKKKKKAVKIEQQGLCEMKLLWTASPIFAEFVHSVDGIKQWIQFYRPNHVGVYCPVDKESPLGNLLSLSGAGFQEKLKPSCCGLK